jgi:hypothetical protein
MDLSVPLSEEDMSLPAAVYRPRRPQDSDYYRCVEDYFETFVQIYDEHFSRQYGFWRPYSGQTEALTESFAKLLYSSFRRRTESRKQMQ